MRSLLPIGRTYRRRIPIVVHSRSGLALVRESRLLWTEAAYLVVFSLVAFIVADPFDLGFRHATLTKHIGLVLTMPILVVHLLSRSLTLPLWQRQAIGLSLGQTWPWLVLALIVTLGSVYAERVRNIDNNFLSLGSYIPFVFLGSAVMATAAAPMQLLRAYFMIWIAAAGTMALLVAVEFGRNRFYHEEIFLIVPVALFFAMSTRLGVWRWPPALAFVAIGVLSRKNTSYLVGLVTLVYFFIMVWLPADRAHRSERITGALKVYALIGVFTLVAASVGYVLVNRQKYLPSGNVEYRLHMYRKAFDRFAESPAWGSGFTDSASIRFTKFTVATPTQILPVHSDILDILAHGGAFAFLLWGFGLWKAARCSWDKLLRPQLLGEEWARFAHTLALSSLCAVVVYAFNPVLTSLPAISYVLWTNLGLLVGLAVRRKLKDTLS